jgi:hypothetical protein
LDRQGVNLVEELFQMRHIPVVVVGAYKGEQGDLVLGRQVSQDVIGSDLCT